MITINRLVQVPVQGIEYSKNLVDITISADTPEELAINEQLLDTSFNKQMTRFKQSIEELKWAEEYARLLKQAEFLKYLKTRPIYAQVQQEFVRYEQLNNSK